MTILSFFVLCVFFLIFFLGNKFYFEDKKNPMNITFSLGCISTSIGMFLSFMNIQSHTPADALFWGKLQFVTYLSLPFFLHYTLIFTKSTWLKYKLTYIILYLPVFIFLVLRYNMLELGPKQSWGGYTFRWNSDTWDNIRLFWQCCNVFFIVWLNFAYSLKTKGKVKAKARFLGFTFGLTVFTGLTVTGITRLFNYKFSSELRLIVFSVPAALIIFMIIKNYKLFTINPVTAAENIISTMNEALILLDQDCKIVNLNHSAQNILGFMEKELVGNPIDKIFSDEKIHTELMKKIANDECIDNYESYFQTKNGEKIPIIISSSLLKDEQEELVGVVIVARDILERKQAEMFLRESEEKYRLLVENAGAAILIVDNSGKVEYMNSNAIILFGAEEVDFNGKTLWDFLPQDRANNLICGILDVIHSKKAINIESLLSYQGQLHWLNANLQPLLDSNDFVSKVQIIANDITKIKQTEQALISQAEKLTKSNAELHEFVYIASHDLQEPLRKVIAFGDRLKANCFDSLTEQGRDYLDRMQNAVIRMQALINDLLVYSRVTTKTQAFIKVNLSQIVKEVVSDLEFRIEQKGGSINVSPLPVIEADPTQMRQLFQNLIGNSLKFCKREIPPVVKINSSIFNNKGIMEDEIIVEDNGIGIEDKYLDRIFGVFQRLHGRDEYEGTGIGLAICKKIIEWHGGSIKVESKLDVGSRFIIRIPVKSGIKGE